MARYRPGQSGNPQGRPRGVPDRRRELRDLVRPHVPELIEQALKLARGGDAAAIRLLLDRALPPLKPTVETVVFPAPASGSLAELGRAVLGAIAAGQMPPDVGRHLIEALSAQGRLVEQSELIARIEALEKGELSDD